MRPLATTFSAATCEQGETRRLSALRISHLPRLVCLAPPQLASLLPQAFLDEIDTLEGGDEPVGNSNAAAAGAADSLSGKGAGTAPPSAMISKPPAKAEPTKAVYASRPVRNDDPPQVGATRPSVVHSNLCLFLAGSFVVPDRLIAHLQVPIEVPEPVSQVARPPFAMGGGGGTPMMPPPIIQTQMMQSQAIPPAAAPANAAPPPMYRVPPPPIQHVIPQQPAGSGAPEEEKKRKTMRMAADKIWEDESLADWPEGRIEIA